MTEPNASSDRDRRTRLLVYGGLALLAFGLWASVAYLRRQAPLREDQAWMDVDYQSLPEIQLLQDYVRIDTSTTTGSEIEGAQFLAEQFRAAGIPVHIERLGDSQANLWAILEGQSKEALVLHNHIDVYPVEDAEAWDQPPFSGNLEKAWIYGRGVFDMKSVAIAQLLAMLDLKQSGTVPKRSIIFLATGSEEVGSELGTRWILQQHPDLAQRFWAVLTEGGIVEPVTLEDIKYWGLEFSQKRFANGEACASSPERLEAFREDILTVKESTLDRRLSPEVETFLRTYADSRGPAGFTEVLQEIQRALDHTSDFHSLPAYLQAMFRDEIVPFPVEESLDGEFRMRLAVHLLPGSNLDETMERLMPEWARHGITLTMGPALGYDGGSPLDHEAFEVQQAAVLEAFPDATVGPYFLPWSATDSRFFRAAGIPSYGFSPFVIFNTDTFRVDTTNERLGLPGFVNGVELYKRVVRQLVD